MRTEITIQFEIPDDCYEDIISKREFKVRYCVSDANYAHMVGRAVLPSLCTMCDGDVEDEEYKIVQVPDGAFAHDIHSSREGTLLIRRCLTVPPPDVPFT